MQEPEGVGSNMLERYEAHIKPDGGRALVVGSAIIGGAAVLAGLILSEPLLVVVALVAFAVSLYNYPLLAQREAHLAASLQGLELDGLGLLAWRAIQSMEFDGTKTLTLNLNGKLDNSVKQSEDASALRTLQVTLWKMQGPQTLTLDLSHYFEEPDDIHRAIRARYEHSQG